VQEQNLSRRRKASPFDQNLPKGGREKPSKIPRFCAGGPAEGGKKGTGKPEKDEKTSQRLEFVGLQELKGMEVLWGSEAKTPAVLAKSKGNWANRKDYPSMGFTASRDSKEPWVRTPNQIPKKRPRERTINAIL